MNLLIGRAVKAITYSSEKSYLKIQKLFIRERDAQYVSKYVLLDML